MKRPLPHKKEKNKIKANMIEQSMEKQNRVAFKKAGGGGKTLFPKNYLEFVCNYQG